MLSGILAAIGMILATVIILNFQDNQHTHQGERYVPHISQEAPTPQPGTLRKLLDDL